MTLYPAVTQLKANNHDIFVHTGGFQLMVVAYLPSSTEPPAPEYTKLAKLYRHEMSFGLSTDPETC